MIMRGMMLIVTPSEYVGNIMKIAMDKRGTYINTTYLDPTRADLQFEFPLAEIIFDFYEFSFPYNSTEKLNQTKGIFLIKNMNNEDLHQKR